MVNTNPIQTVKYRTINGRRYAESSSTTDSRGRTSSKNFDLSKIEAQQKEANAYNERTIAEAKAKQQLEQDKAKEVQRIQELQKAEAQKKQEQQTITIAQQIQTQRQLVQQQRTNTPTKTKISEVPKVNYSFSQDFEARKQNQPTFKDILRAEKTGEESSTITSSDGSKTTTTTSYYALPKESKTIKDKNTETLTMWEQPLKEIGEYKEKGVTPTEIKLTGFKAEIPKVSESSKELLRKVASGEVKIKINNIDDVIKARADVEREVFQLRGTSLEGTTEIEKLYSSSQTKINEFTFKKAGTFTAVTLGTAGLITTISPMVAGITATTTGKVVATGLAGTYVYNVGKGTYQVATGKGFEGKPIARAFEGLDIGGQILAITIGGISVKNKSINPETFEAKGVTDVVNIKGGTKLTQLGEVKTFGGKIQKVRTDVFLSNDGTGTYQTTIGKTLYQQAKPQFLDKGKIDFLEIRLNNKVEFQMKATSEISGRTTISKQFAEITPSGEYSFLTNQYASLTSENAFLSKNLELSRTGTDFVRTKSKTGSFGEMISIKNIGEKSTTTTKERWSIKPKEAIPTKLIRSTKGSSSIGSIQPSLINVPFTSSTPFISSNIMGSSNFALTTITNIPAITPIVIPLGLSNIKEDTETKTIYSSSVLNISPSKSFSRSRTSTDTITEAITDVTPITQPITSSSTSTSTTTNIITEVVVPVKPTPQIPPITTILITPPPIKLGKEKITKQTNLGTGYDVFTRKGGKLIKVNVGGSLEKSEALDFGAKIVSTSARASFKLVKSSSPMTRIKGKSYKGTFTKTRKNLYESKGFFIEKRSKRIKSLGEKGEITFKGIWGNKTKNMWG